MDGFKAFAEATSISFADLTVESDESQLAIYGRLTLTADAPSQATLDHLIAVLSQARADLARAMAEGAAPPVKPQALPSVRNPFA